MERKAIPAFSIPLACIVAACSIIGLITPGFYEKETINWQAQSYGQDLADLVLVVPALLFTGWKARQNAQWMPVWGGVIFYLAYTFVLYCFDVHFNRIFFLYCLALGIAFYAGLYFMKHALSGGIVMAAEKPVRTTGVFFIVVAIAFYLLWLSEILPASFSGTLPKSLEEAGLFTNGVHVLDLAIVLPAIFMTGILLLNKKSMGYFLAPAFLSFFILMDLTIAFLVLLMYNRGLTGTPVVSIAMILLAVYSSVLLSKWTIK